MNVLIERLLFWILYGIWRIILEMCDMRLSRELVVGGE